LRLGDIDLAQGMLIVRRNGFKGRRLPLGHEALEAVRVYVEQYRLSGRTACITQGGMGDKSLFLSETGHALTENGMVLVFRRLIPIRELKDNLEMREMRHRGNVVRMISENIERRTEFVSE